MEEPPAASDAAGNAQSTIRALIEFAQSQQWECLITAPEGLEGKREKTQGLMTIQPGAFPDYKVSITIQFKDNA